MRIYLDDDSVSALLAQLLRRAGHDVQLPIEVGLAGADDPVHLTHAVVDNRVLLSHNHDDFAKLQDLAMALRGHHPGIVIVRKDNNPKRDLSERGIGRAIAKLLASGIPIADQLHILNQWR
jgi:predicted nuclease of predicted toxin-antitoxin system